MPLSSLDRRGFWSWLAPKWWRTTTSTFCSIFARSSRRPVSERERLFAVASVGRSDLLIAAEHIERLAPAAEAAASEWRCVDLADGLGLNGTGALHAILVRVDRDAAWLLVDRGTRFVRIATKVLRELPPWIQTAGSPLVALARLGEEGRFAFELGLDRLLGGEPQ